MNGISLLTNETLLITGAAGSIGRELVLGFAFKKPKRLILVDISETGLHSLLEELTVKFSEVTVSYFVESVCNADFLNHLFVNFKITSVFHAAAYKHVSLMQENTCAAITTNILGAQLLIDSSIKYKVNQVVVISTDKAVSPVNTMGRTKKVVESYLNFRLKDCVNTKLIALRLCNVYGSAGSVVPVFKKRIEQNLPIEIKDKNLVRDFISSTQVLEMFNYLLANKELEGLFIPKKTEKKAITQIATEVLHAFAVDAKSYPIVFTKLPKIEKLEEKLWSSTESRKNIENSPLVAVENTTDILFDLQIMQECIAAAQNYSIENAQNKLVVLTSA
ncbi:polysaccharide biosynthesis protein [Leeuwenhoekiella sp. NPDC079379]|uniref:polysaccharide biosynthesis protein n=1 Tax=Leeuwenhoekiella sp. NPDC079379 TaxID=3364122 RepID=UPI0037C8DB3C